jgi:transposase
MSEIAEFMKKNKGLSRRQLAEKFECSTNNITNVKRRYNLQYDFATTLQKKSNQGKMKKHDRLRKQTKSKQTSLLNYEQIIFLTELWSHLTAKRLVKKEVRCKFLKIIMHLNNSFK